MKEIVDTTPLSIALFATSWTYEENQGSLYSVLFQLNEAKYWLGKVGMTLHSS